MDITQKILSAALTLGAAWVMWLLLGLSWLSIAVVIERIVYFIMRASGAHLPDAIAAALQKGDLAEARRLCEGRRFAHAVGAAGLAAIGRGARAVGEALMAARARERIRAERFLVILGTLGNNAPFIGLFGTVHGIIKAFHDLGRNQSGGASAVMAGIAEALVATAIGLMVAIPAVVAYNAFQRAVRAQVARSDEVAHVVLTYVEEHPHESVVAATTATAASAVSAAEARLRRRASAAEAD
jgi:biopolymer transport protein ExbB/TolQ